MAKDPAFLFYPGDWVSGTMGMTFEEKGAYFELLMAQFNRGHLTSDMISRMIGQLWVKVQDKFIQDSKGLWYNARLEEEQLKRKNFVLTRKNNLSGNNQHKKKVGHTTSRMENENRNENVIDNTLNKGVVIEKLFNDELYVEGLRIAHRGKDIKQAFEECYIHHSNAPNPPQTLGEWRQKLNTWLSNAKLNKNGTSKDKREQQSNDRKAAFTDRVNARNSGEQI
jgi:uncharacterized protein YdaU (DUF1376 family)